MLQCRPESNPQSADHMPPLSSLYRICFRLNGVSSDHACEAARPSPTGSGWL